MPVNTKISDDHNNAKISPNCFVKNVLFFTVVFWRSFSDIKIVFEIYFFLHEYNIDRLVDKV